MATPSTIPTPNKSPAIPGPPSETQQNLAPESSPNPITPTTTASATPLTPASDPKPTTPATATVPHRPREPPATDSDVVHIPSYSKWFSWNGIHECETRFLPEFFNGRSPSRNPGVYKFYRNAIVRKFRDSIKENPPSKENPSPKITFTEARKSIIGDVGSVRRVFDFLETWGLINYYGSPSLSKSQLKWDDSKDSKSMQQGNDSGGGNAAGEVSASKKRICSTCNSVCTIACFSSIKKDMTLCARCYVRGGVNSSDFKRVEITEDIKTDWTDKETLNLLEAVLHFGDDWKKVAERVVGRNDKECVNRFIKLPFGEHFIGPPDSSDGDENVTRHKDQLDTESSSSKRMRLTPLADASNPIMAQAAFLSALVGVDVAEAAAAAAVKALSEFNGESSKEIRPSSIVGAREKDSCATTDGKTTTNSLEGVYAEAQLQLVKEEQDLERAISNIAEVQTKEFHNKIVHFEELELQMERERQQLQQMQNLLFVDQLTLLFHKNAGQKMREIIEENVKTE